LAGHGKAAFLPLLSKHNTGYPIEQEISREKAEEGKKARVKDNVEWIAPLESGEIYKGAFLSNIIID
jgi:hypothetical protein